MAESLRIVVHSFVVLVLMACAAFAVAGWRYARRTPKTPIRKHHDLTNRDDATMNVETGEYLAAIRRSYPAAHAGFHPDREDE